MTFFTIFVIIILLYLLMIMPRLFGRPDHSQLLGVYYAHRGLHDNKTSAPENSMKAFRKAVEAGYGIELDVQLSKDRIPVVFHDENLKRVCGIDGNIRDYTYAELQKFSLLHSSEQIPLFEDFLKLVNGKVPLIVEIKSHENVDTLCSIIDQQLKTYTGPYCVESFDPFVVRWYKKHRPEVIRGQLSTDFNTPENRELISEKLVHYLLTNWLCRPDFIAYDHQHKNNISRLLCKNIYDALGVTWTVKSQEQLDNCRDDFSLFIFEGFLPDKN